MTARLLLLVVLVLGGCDLVPDYSFCDDGDCCNVFESCDGQTCTYDTDCDD